MASFLEALGRSGRVPALTEQVTAIPFNKQKLESNALDIERDKTNLAIDNLKFEELKRQQDIYNRPVPADMLRGMFRFPEAADYAEQLVTDAGIMKKSPNNTSYLPFGEVPSAIKLMELPGPAARLSQIMSEGFNREIEQTKQGIQSGKLKPEELRAEQLKLNKLYQEQASFIANDEKRARLEERVHELRKTGKWTEESLMEYRKTGGQTQLQPVTETKKIERVIDLGDRQRVFYTDGTQKDMPKGAAQKTGKEPTPVSWKNAADYVSLRFGKQDPLGNIIVTEENSGKQRIAQKKLVELKKQGDIEPLDAVNIAEDYARAVEEKYWQIVDAGEYDIETIQKDYKNQYGYIPSRR